MQESIFIPDNPIHIVDHTIIWAHTITASVVSSMGDMFHIVCVYMYFYVHKEKCDKIGKSQVTYKFRIRLAGPVKASPPLLRIESSGKMQRLCMSQIVWTDGI